jgi:hypothetical protein
MVGELDIDCLLVSGRKLVNWRRMGWKNMTWKKLLRLSIGTLFLNGFRSLPIALIKI